MAGQRWSDFRGKFSGKLIETRAHTLYLKALTIRHVRVGDSAGLAEVDQELGWISGRYAPFTTDLASARWFMERMAPNWGQTGHNIVGGYHIVKFTDYSGRGREDFKNKFVSANLISVVLYSALSVYLIDLNSMFDEIGLLSPKFATEDS